MPSAFMDELMRRRVISDLYVSFPEVPIMVTSDIVITTVRQKIVLELLATATKEGLSEHFERVLRYAEQLSANIFG
ncbi:9499_t:CDS:2 [Rhizophagus irregularis]|nr:9499_t:CDS:2 [Rhizophagus irregularis]